MIHVEKIMFHAADGFWREISDRKENMRRGMKKIFCSADFWRGVIVIVAASAIIFGIGVWLVHLNERDKGFIKYVQQQIEIEKLQEIEQ